jgi:hypothetical protein
MSLATDTPPERTMELRRSRPIAKPSDLLEYRYSHTLQLPPLHSTSLHQLRGRGRKRSDRSSLRRLRRRLIDLAARFVRIVQCT